MRSQLSLFARLGCSHSVAKRLLGALAISFKDTCPSWKTYIRNGILRGLSSSMVGALRGEHVNASSSAVLEQYLAAGTNISSAIEELGDSRRTLEEFIIPLAKVGAGLIIGRVDFCVEGFSWDEITVLTEWLLEHFPMGLAAKVCARS